MSASHAVALTAPACWRWNRKSMKYFMLFAIETISESPCLKLQTFATVQRCESSYPQSEIFDTFFLHLLSRITKKSFTGLPVTTDFCILHWNPLGKGTDRGLAHYTIWAMTKGNIGIGRTFCRAVWDFHIETQKCEQSLKHRKNCKCCPVSLLIVR